MFGREGVLQFCDVVGFCVLQARHVEIVSCGFDDFLLCFFEEFPYFHVA